MASSAAAFAAALNQPIERDSFDTIWGLSPLFVNAGIDAVLLLYGLEHTFIVIEDAPPIPAVAIANVLLWLDIDAFLLSGGGACVDGCDTPTFTIQ